MSLGAGTRLGHYRRARFEQEASAASALNHPNIVTVVHDMGSAEGVLYVAIELVEGTTVRALADAEPVPPKKLLDAAVQVADGLASAHAAGIVHRDLKPGNLILSREYPGVPTAGGAGAAAVL